MKKKTMFELDIADPKCKVCFGEGWVCENHPYMAWKNGEAGCCGGAGAPCKCNRLYNNDKGRTRGTTN